MKPVQSLPPCIFQSLVMPCFVTNSSVFDTATSDFSPVLSTPMHITGNCGNGQTLRLCFAFFEQHLRMVAVCIDYVRVFFSRLKNPDSFLTIVWFYEGN